MKEWILENTDISEEEYNKLINLNTISINGKSNLQPNQKISNHPIINIALFTSKKSSIRRRKKFKIKKLKDINKKNYYTYQKIKFYMR